MQIDKHNPEDQKHCIQLNAVSFAYDNEAVLEDISFNISQGDYLGIIGPNGGGKTTLLKIILGLLKPTSGSVRVFGQDIYNLKSERAHIGYVPQRSSQIDTNFPATVGEIVASGRTARLGLFGSLQQEDKDAIARALEITEMAKHRNTLINSLSGGQRQRVFIARALAGDPQVLILDEPTVGVDIASQEQFFKFLADLHSKHGLTILLVSHDIDVVAKEVHTLLAINKKVVLSGPAEELVSKNYLEELYGKNINFTIHNH